MDFVLLNASVLMFLEFLIVIRRQSVTHSLARIMEDQWKLITIRLLKLRNQEGKNWDVFVLAISMIDPVYLDI